MRILTRYVLRSLLAPFTFAVAALTLLMLLNELGKRFGKLVGKGLEWTVIVEVFALSIPFILALTLPMAVLMAVLYTFNRMAGDNEITAMKANGIHLPRLVAPVTLMAALLALGMVWFNNTVLPESNHRLQVLISSISQKKPTFVLQERTINEVLDGEMYIQAARVDRATNDLQDVVIYDERRPEQSRTIYADSGRMALSQDKTDLFLNLYRGHSQQHRRGEPESFQRIRFRHMVMRVPDVSNKLQRQELGGYRGEREMSIPQLEAEVRTSRRSQLAAAEESRWLAVYLTHRLLGRELPDPDSVAPGAGPAADRAAAPEGSPAGSARASAATGSLAATAGSLEAGDADAPDTAAAGTATGTRVADAGTAGAVGDTAAAARDSVTADARRQALDTAGRLSAAVSPSSQFRSLARSWSSSVSRANRFAVEIHKKYSIPAACIVFVLIGAPLAVRFRTAGVAMVVGASLLIFCAYYVSLVGGEELSEDLVLSPFWAMWAPNVLFGAVGAGALWRAVKVG